MNLNMFDILERDKIEVNETKNKFESLYYNFYEQEDNNMCVINVLK